MSASSVTRPGDSGPLNMLEHDQAQYGRSGRAPEAGAAGSAGARTAGAEGLVICAKTGEAQRTEPSFDLETELPGLWKPQFPGTELLSAAISMLPKRGQAVGPDVQVPAGYEVQRDHQGRLRFHPDHRPRPTANALDTVLPEGPTWRISIAPGMVQFGTKDYARAQRTEQRQQRTRELIADQLAAELMRTGTFPAKPPSTREITGWSQKSRVNMIRTMLSLDYGPMFADPNRVPAMATLTYSGDWLTVAPNGKAAKKHFNNWRKAYEHAWGEKLVCVWKMEFQFRGAPHFHLLMAPPHGVAQAGKFQGLNFREWLSQSWAATVNHPDPEEYKRHVNSGTGVDLNDGLRSTDPKRVAVYFSKHGSFKAKDYQNQVPEEWQEPGQGPGRFWGVRQLKKAVYTADLTPQDAYTLSRTARRWADAQNTTRQSTRPRTKGGRPASKYPEVIGLAGAQLIESRGPTRYRTSRTKAKRLTGGRGFLSVNDGAAFTSQLVRVLTL